MQGDKLNLIFEGAIEDIFYRLDTLISNSLDYEEFKDFNKTILD